MAGHMGAANVTTQNLEVVRIDIDRGLILVKGAVPGSKGGWVMIRDAIKKGLPEGAPLPGAFRTADDAGAVKEETKAETPAEEEVDADAAADAPAAEEAPAQDAGADEATDDKKDDA